MPELPEVETLCRQLRGVVAGKVILKFDVLDPRIGDPGELGGRRIVSIQRQGKALLLLLDQGAFVALHLRMTGTLLWRDIASPLLPHTRFTASFATGRLDCIDPRRFATLTYRDGAPADTSAIDPFERDSADRLLPLACNRRLPVKSFLLDQRFVGGIGNIYACEILYAAAVSPWRMTSSLSPLEWRFVAEAAVSILSRAIACRGTTVSDWRDLFGQKGAYQHELSVYAREGEQCFRCHGIIQRVRLHGRGTYFCPFCQK